ncbi:MAG: hypothetical protein KJP16_02700 [Gammaproteobacteria bacterium]|nr:hypothetical protein [Gammaproteobacteria bacterium]NNL49701.1 hypothetical protein [Woeseiaceae bacterium]
MRCCAPLLVLICSVGQASPLFEQHDILEITLEGPLSTLKKDTEARREQPFRLSLGDQVFKVDAKLRGNSRVEFCLFPPIRLNFAKSNAQDSVFAGQKGLKLVTHCKGGANYEKNMLEEYAAYRILNVLTDMSFRTRLLHVRYVDSERPDRDALVRYAFLIEPEKALAKRNGGTLLKARHVTKPRLAEPHAALVYVFQYLIGNTDWSLVRAFDSETCCHNGELVGLDDRQYYVPYDFDMAGLVNARYAVPNPDLRLTRVTQRRYRGHCATPEAVREALRSVVGRYDDILQVIAELPGFSEDDIASSSRYLEGFFKRAANEEKLLREFQRRCLK